MSKARLLAAFSCVLVVGVCSSALAQRAALPLDPSVPFERALYSELRVQERFGIKFRPYASVCTAVARDRARCLAKIVTDDQGVPLAFNPSQQTLPGYAPDQLRAAYGVTGVAKGATPIIGIVDAYYDPAAIDDLKVYSKQFKLPVLAKCKGSALTSSVPCIQIANQKGGKKLPSTQDGGWTDEQSIDLDMAHALCENCSIVLIEANSNGIGDLFASENAAASLGANVISNSWGTAEFSGEPSADSQFLTHPGVVITASTGDHGYAGGVSYPASSPNVVAVGGTSLFLVKDGTKYGSEVAWEGTGSGCSAYEARPSWQPSLSGCPSNRTVSDISVDADPSTGVTVYDSSACTGGASCWFMLGGTSISAPIVAALYALSGDFQSRGTQGAAVLYTNVSKKNARDITTGSNGSCDFAYLCNAVAGYDGPTGLGSPKGLGIFATP